MELLKKYDLEQEMDFNEDNEFEIPEDLPEAWLLKYLVIWESMVGRDLYMYLMLLKCCIYIL